MLELKGKYNKAKVFTNIINEKAIDQIITLLNQPMAEGEQIRIMPDVHAGAGCTIGTTMTITDKAVPNLVGVDIGCGMETVCLKETHIEVQKLDKFIRSHIPSGFSVRKKIHKYMEKINLNDLYCINHINYDRAEKSLGTLGGGNHFIEANRNEDGLIYIVIHSGSRHLGLEVANYYQEEAYRWLNGCSEKDKDELIARLKAEGKEKQIQKELKKMKNVKCTNVPKPLAYTQGELFEQYIHDMKLVQEYAILNRNAMMDDIVKEMGLHIKDHFTTVHNYIDTENMILRKGAVSAQNGEVLLIPINMRDGSLICTGKGNPDWNYSAPHGAGRILSRGEARSTLTLSEFKKQMEGIYSTSVSRDTIDESPMAYKSMDDIVSNIGDTVNVDSIIKPIYNFKASSEN